MSKSTNYFSIVQKLVLDIKGIKKLIASLERERDRAILRQAPADAKAVTYDFTRGSMNIVPIMVALGEIMSFQSEIDYLNETLADKERTLAELERDGKQTAEKLNDTVLKVFLLSFVHGKRNVEIAEELQYSIYTIEKAKTEINAILVNDIQ